MNYKNIAKIQPFYQTDYHLFYLYVLLEISWLNCIVPVESFLEL